MTDRPNDTSLDTMIRVFGGVAVLHGDEPVSVGGPRQRRLLALLAIRTGSIASVDWIAEHLWNDEERPEATAPAIRTYVSRLRQALPEPTREWVRTESAGYRLDAPADVIEHLWFRAVRAEARRARENEDPLMAHTLLTRALDAWRGEPFLELEDVDAARGLIEQLRLEQLEMFEERWEAALALGRHTQITAELASFTSEHGRRDRAAQQHALALHRSGRTADALQAVADYRERLADETGLEPSAGMLELEASLLAGDPSLDFVPSGRPLRGYRLIEETGVGAFSVVWRAQQPSVQRTVAIKQIRRELAASPDFVRRFEVEAHLVAQLEHPHIVPLIDFWRDPESAYLVMRWLPGGTLEQRLDDGPLDLETTLGIAEQIGGALASAHRAGVIHRDVKTANILFDSDGRSFLTDFGIAMEIDATAGPEAALSPGSPAYASPEQRRGERLGPEADVFSLGVILFECLTGSLPFFEAVTLEELGESRLDAEFPTLAELRADVPRHVSEAIASATRKQRGQRFATIDEFLAALSGQRTSTAESSALTAAGPIRNPYVGLRAFDSADRARFFGRERLVTEMVDRFSTPPATSAFGDNGGVRLDRLTARALIVVGPSGSGKSSLVRAGLIPSLRLATPPTSELGPSSWYSTSMVPGTSPFEALEAALLRIAVNPPASLLGQLKDGPRGLLRSVRRCLPKEGGPPVLLLIDQFEEIFLGAAAADADAFLTALAVAVEEPTSPIRLIATLRADHYHRPLQHPAFARILATCAVDLAPLAPDELERAIVAPATAIGGSFEPGLVARLTAGAVGQSSPLPLLQHVLRELFERRGPGGMMTIAAHDDLGGLSGSLARQADALFDQATSDQRRAIRQLFGRLTDPSGPTTDLRRRRQLADVGQDPDTKSAIDRYTEARLLTLDRDPISREPTVEVAHEALLRAWPRLAAWLEEDRSLLRTLDQVADAATKWSEAGRVDTDLYRGDRLDTAAVAAEADPGQFRDLDLEFLVASTEASRAAEAHEQQRIRRLRLLLAGTAVALAAALIAGAVAFAQLRRADDEARRAEQEAARAEVEAAAANESAEEAERQTETAQTAARAAEFSTLISRSAAAEQDDPELSLLLALEATRRSATIEERAAAEQALLDRLGSAELATTVSSLPELAATSCLVTTVDSDGAFEFVALDSELVSRNALSGEQRIHGPAPEPCVDWMGDADLDRRAVNSPDGLRHWAGTFEGPLDVERTFESPTFRVKSSFRPTGRLVMLTQADTAALISLVDDSTLATVSEPVTGGDDFFNAEVNDDGSLVAASFGTFDREGGDGEVVVLDGRDGTEQLRVRLPLPISYLFFDDDRSELLGITIDGQLVTIDLESGNVVAEVPHGAAGEVFDLRLLDGGLLQLLTSGQIVTVDRDVGVVGEPIDLPRINGGRFRPDGLITGFAPGGGTDVVDLSSNALISQRFDVDPTGFVAIANGIAVSAPPGSGSPTRVDLTSGVQDELSLTLPDGGVHRPIVIHPEADVLWTYGPEGEVQQWRDGELMARLPVAEVGFIGNVYEGQWPYLTGERGGADAAVRLIDLTGDGPVERFSISAPGTINAHPAVDGGLHTTDVDGVLATFDSRGASVDQFETGINAADVIAVDPSSQRVAVASSFFSGVAIVDRSTGTVERLAEFDTVVNLGFARNGDYLVLTSLDGNVRLWDIERQRFAGLVFEGAGARTGGSPWFEPATDSVWVSTSGSVIQIPLDPIVWADRACDVTGRDLTGDEWERFVPGDEPLASACP